jgi:outer membrane protein assembly factor BamB
VSILLKSLSCGSCGKTSWYACLRTAVIQSAVWRPPTWFFVVAAAMLSASAWTAATAAEPSDSVASPSAAVWPQWRGPSRDGFIATGTPPWPDRIDAATLKQSWRVDLGPSYSGPIVAADHVFVTETENATNEVVRALDRRTGAKLWQASWKGSMRVPFFALSNGSWIRATPAYDGESLFVAGMRDVLVSLNAASGKVQWRVDFVSDFKKSMPAFGLVSSPLVQGDFLYVQAGGAVRKLDKHSGDLVWAALDEGGGMYGGAFSSPVMATISGKQQLVVQTRQKLAGIDLGSGAILWSQKIPSFRGMNILTPTVFEDSVFTSSYGGRAWLFHVTREAKGFTLAEAWNVNTQAYMSTPIIIDGHAYLHLKNRRFTCIDLRTGEKKWTTPPYGKYWSLVANGDRILALDQRGILLLIRATPEKYDLLDERKVSSDSTWAHLAVCDRDIFIRELGGMTAYRWGSAE